MANETVTRKTATDDYMAGMSYAKLAEKYGVSLNTVKSWKQRWAWSREGVHTDAPKNKKQGCTPKHKKNAPSVIPARPVPDEDGDELTPKEKLFCDLYVESFNGAQAARRAGYAAKHAKEYACNLMKKPRVRRYIEQLKTWKREALLAGQEDILDRYMRIAFADLGDYVKFGTRQVPVLNPLTGEPIEMLDPKTRLPITLTRAENYVDVSNMDEVDTSLISEIKQGRDGISIKMVDRLEALAFLRAYFGMNPMDQHKIAFDNAKLVIEQRANETSADALSKLDELLVGINGVMQHE